MRKLVAYLAHPVGPGSTVAELEARQRNIANTHAWLRFLVDHTDFAISVPWLPYVQTLEELTYRERGIADDLAGLERCDLVILCGGQVSAGMAKERELAIKLGMPVVDLTSFGYHPPALDEERARAVIAFRANRATSARPRRVWLPPLTPARVENLKIASAIVRSSGTEHEPAFIVDDAIATLAEIIAAAEARPT